MSPGLDRTIPKGFAKGKPTRKKEIQANQADPPSDSPSTGPSQWSELGAVATSEYSWTEERFEPIRAREGRPEAESCNSIKSTRLRTRAVQSGARVRGSQRLGEPDSESFAPSGGSRDRGSEKAERAAQSRTTHASERKTPRGKTGSVRGSGESRSRSREDRPGVASGGQARLELSPAGTRVSFDTRRSLAPLDPESAWPGPVDHTPLRDASKLTLCSPGPLVSDFGHDI